MRIFREPANKSYKKITLFLALKLSDKTSKFGRVPGARHTNGYPGTRSSKWHYPVFRVGSGLKLFCGYPFLAGTRRVLPLDR